MDVNSLRVETYLYPNGAMNFPNLQAHVRLFVDTVWQRSKEDNAKGFEFFASLWKDKRLVHRGALEGRRPTVAAAQKDKTPSTKDSKVPHTKE